MHDALESLKNTESYAIIDKGLSQDDRSCILIENGKFYGMGYLPPDVQISDIESIRDYIKPHKENFYIRDLVMNESLLSSATHLRFDRVLSQETYQ